MHNQCLIPSFFHQTTSSIPSYVNFSPKSFSSSPKAKQPFLHLSLTRLHLFLSSSNQTEYLQTPMSRHHLTNSHLHPPPPQQPTQNLHPPPPPPGHNIHFPTKQQPDRRLPHNAHPTPSPPPSSLRIPQPHKTRPHTWLIGAFCAVFWIAVILGGLVILTFYLVFRPKSPELDITGASLNAAYLDMGYLLNADMTLLANFTNPSKKATVDFSSMTVLLYYGDALIATGYVDPFSAMQAQSKFRNVHLVSSQVRLPGKESRQLKQEMENSNRVRFEVKGQLRTQSNLGGLFRYSYWLYGHCTIEVSGPPGGVLVAKKCITKR